MTLYSAVPAVLMAVHKAVEHLKISSQSGSLTHNGKPQLVKTS